MTNPAGERQNYRRNGNRDPHDTKHVDGDVVQDESDMVESNSPRTNTLAARSSVETYNMYIFKV
jgi:hypothetical protein